MRVDSLQIMKSTEENFDDFDGILRQLNHGKWQNIHFALTSLAIFITPTFVYAGTFLAPAMDYKCVAPEDSWNYSKKDECTLMRNDSVGSEQLSCTEFSYSNQTFGTTITTEYDLVCDDAYLRSMYQTLYMITGIGAGVVNGMLSDKFGRKIYTLLVMVIVISCSIFPTLTTSFHTILAFRAVIDTLPSTLYLNTFNWSMEICAPKLRSRYGLLLSIPWSFGMMFFGLMAYMIRDWRWLQRAGSVPCFLVLFILWFTDESPRWLIVNGRHDEALAVVQKAARYNNVTLPPESELRKRMELIQTCGSSPTDEIKDDSKLSKLKSYGTQLLKAMKCAELRRRAILVYAAFFCCFCVYDGLALNAVNFSLDPYLYMITGGLAEIPSYLAVIPLIARYGRIWPSVALFFVSGVSIMALAFISPEIVWLVMTLSILGKFAIAAAFQIMFLISSEIIPTDVKLVVWCFGYAISKLGAVGAGFLTGMVEDDQKWIPALAMGGVSFFASFILVFIPESLNKSIPDTIDSLKPKANKATEIKEKSSEDFQSVSIEAGTR